MQFIADNVAEYVLSDRTPQKFSIKKSSETIFAIKVPAPDIVNTIMGPQSCYYDSIVF